MMHTKQIFFMIAMIAVISAPTMVISVMAQNMTGGNMTGGNMTGKISGGGIIGLTAQGAQDVYIPGLSQSVPTPPPTAQDDVEGQDQSEDEGQDDEGQDQSEDEGEDDEEQEGGN